MFIDDRRRDQISSLLSELGTKFFDNVLEKANILEQVCRLFISSATDTIENETDRSPTTFENEIRLGRDIIMEIESMLESIAYSFESNTSNTISDADSDDFRSTLIESLLCNISLLYENIAQLTEHYQNRTSQDVTIIAEAYLDYAIASKRANNNLQQCVYAHLKRMDLCSKYKITDAVRLLGLSSSSKTEQMNFNNKDNKDRKITIEEICNDGVFHSVLHEINGKDDNYSNLFDSWYPSENAINIGMKAREVFINSKYSFDTSIKMLLHLIGIPPTRMLNNQNDRRFFSANSFFNHRHDLLSKNNHNEDCIDEALFEKLPGSNDSKLLTYLFLFGIAVDIERAINLLGTDQLSSLFDARLIRKIPCNENYIVAECQIYPLHTSCFDNDFTAGTGYPLFFMTDWPLESLRLPRDAIMAVGYDTLELMALSSGTQLFNTGIESSRVLDLCCGCGIQGIFAAAREHGMILNERIPGKNQSNKHHLVCMDINERAKHFVTGNICLNGLSKGNNIKNSSPFDIFFIHGDLYEPIIKNTTNLTTLENASHVIGHFNHIISNPPFVAVPKTKGPISLYPALYSAGGGMDGMNLLRRILIDYHKILKRESSSSSLLMVTELPNVEESCTLIKSLLGMDVSEKSRIRVAYIGDDVEQVEEYAREREAEAGLCVNSQDWNTNAGGIRNRALVLLSLSQERGDANLDLGNYEGPPGGSSDHDADSEDKFLTKDGIKFCRDFIL